jgi:hypothetical protein
MTGGSLPVGFLGTDSGVCARLTSLQKSSRYSFFSDSESFMENPSFANETVSCAVSIEAPSVLNTLLEIKKGV